MNIVYRELNEIAAFEQVVDLEIEVWGVSPRDAVSTDLLHALVLNGSLLVGAYDARNHLVGASLAFPARRDHSKNWLLWSHMAGVHPDYQGQGIGWCLKQFQRTWALEHGYDVIGWTFDPLQRGNANFNLHLLGAVSNIYHVNFYGDMADAINVGLPSDRLEARWYLRDKRVQSLAEKHPVSDLPLVQDAILLCLDENSILRPTLSNLHLPVYYAQIPSDLGQLKKVDPDLAISWRLALREILVTTFNQGYSAVDLLSLNGNSWYILQRAEIWFLYILECNDGSLYTGVTNNLQRRLAAHNAGRGAAYTAVRRPVKLAAAWSCAGRSVALKAEISLKRRSRQFKLELIQGHLPYLDLPFVQVD